MRNKKIIIIFSGILLIFSLIGLGGYLITKKEALPEDVTEIPCGQGLMRGCAETLPLPDIKEYAGNISTSTDGWNTYTNKKYGFQLNYPMKYEVGDNQLGYDANGNKESGEFWISDPSRDMNYGTISISILSSQEYTSMENDKETIKMKKQVLVLGQPTTVFDLEYRSNIHTDRLLVYAILLPSFSNKYLRVQLYDDPSNFHILDEIVRSIIWLPLER